MDRIAQLHEASRELAVKAVTFQLLSDDVFSLKQLSEFFDLETVKGWLKASAATTYDDRTTGKPTKLEGYPQILAGIHGARKKIFNNPDNPSSVQCDGNIEPPEEVWFEPSMSEAEKEEVILQAAKALLTYYIKCYFSGRTLWEIYGTVGTELSDKRMFSQPDRKLKQRPSINTCTGIEKAWEAFKAFEKNGNLKGYKRPAVKKWQEKSYKAITEFEYQWYEPLSVAMLLVFDAVRGVLFNGLPGAQEYLARNCDVPVDVAPGRVPKGWSLEAYQTQEMRNQLTLQQLQSADADIMLLNEVDSSLAAMFKKHFVPRDYYVRIADEKLEQGEEQVSAVIVKREKLDKFCHGGEGEFQVATGREQVVEAPMELLYEEDKGVAKVLEILPKEGNSLQIADGTEMCMLQIKRKPASTYASAAANANPRWEELSKYGQGGKVDLLKGDIIRVKEGINGDGGLLAVTFRDCMLASYHGGTEGTATPKVIEDVQALLAVHEKAIKKKAKLIFGMDANAHWEYKDLKSKKKKFLTLAELEDAVGQSSLKSVWPPGKRESTTYAGRSHFQTQLSKVVLALDLDEAERKLPFTEGTARSMIMTTTVTGWKEGLPVPKKVTLDWLKEVKDEGVTFERTPLVGWTLAAKMSETDFNDGEVTFVGVPEKFENIDCHPKDEIIYSPHAFYATELQVFPPNIDKQPLVPADSIKFPSDHKQLRTTLIVKVA